MLALPDSAGDSLGRVRVVSFGGVLVLFSQNILQVQRAHNARLLCALNTNVLSSNHGVVDAVFVIFSVVNFPMSIFCSGDPREFTAARPWRTRSGPVRSGTMAYIGRPSRKPVVMCCVGVRRARFGSVSLYILQIPVCYYGTESSSLCTNTECVRK